VGGVKILIVDDDVAVGESMAELLRLDRHDVRIAVDADEALAMAQCFAPDVALLDLGLPRVDGYETARRLRALPEGRRILLIAATGSGGDDVRGRCEAAGFDHHFVKPMDFDVLRELIDSARPRPSRSL
jgi:CheY-like chemotaxis protein